MRCSTGRTSQPPPAARTSQIAVASDNPAVAMPIISGTG